MFFKIGVLKIFADFKHLCWSLFLIKLLVWRPATLLKETTKQVFSYEICWIFKNSFFYITPTVAAFVLFMIQFWQVLTSLKSFLECTLPLTFPCRFPVLWWKTPRINSSSMLVIHSDNPLKNYNHASTDCNLPKLRYRKKTKYKNTKIKTCSQGLLPWQIFFQLSVRKYIPPKCLTAKIQTLENYCFSIKSLLLLEADLEPLQHLLMEIFTAIFNGFS